MMKLQTVCVMVLLIAVLWRTVQTTTVCPVNSQHFISSDHTTLLPLTNVRASSEDILHNPVANFVMPSNPPWCTAEEEGRMDGHFVELTFTEPIVAQMIHSSGFVNGYVNNFTILHTMSTDGNDVEAYGILEESQSFLVRSQLDDNEGYFILEQPIVARRLKFAINGGVLEQANRLCWEISIYGCTLATAETIPQRLQTTEPPLSVTVTTPIASTSTNQLPVTTATAKECPPPDVSSLPNITSQNDILIIALPIALATIVVVLFLVILGILICICVTRRRDLKQPEDYDTVTVKMLNNRTRQIIEGGDPNSGTNFHYDSPRLLSYDVPRAVRSRGGSLSVSSTDALNYEIKNPVYSMKRSCAPDTPLQLALMNMPDGSSCSNDYETIPESVTSTENKLYGLHRSNSQPQSNPPNNNNTITAPASVTSSSDLSMMKEKLATDDNESVGRSTTPKQASYNYASVNKPGLASNRRESETNKREGSTPPVFETLYESADQKNDAND